MMIYKDGRIAGVQETLDTDVVPHIASAPWVVSSLVVGTSNVITPSATMTCVGAGVTLLASSTALTTIVDITGSGYVDFIAIQQEAAVSTTLKLVVTVDGVAVCNSTSASASTNHRALMVLGELVDATGIGAGEHPVFFRSSLKIEAQQSGAASARVFVRYRLAAPYSA